MDETSCCKSCADEMPSSCAAPAAEDRDVMVEYRVSAVPAIVCRASEKQVWSTPSIAFTKMRTAHKTTRTVQLILTVPEKARSLTSDA